MGGEATPAPAGAVAPNGYAPPPAGSKVVSSRGWYIAKIVLGSFIITFDLILIGISGGIFAMVPYASAGFLDFILGFPPAALSLCWQIAEFITVCVHRDRRGIHPGAHVGLHLIIWLGFIVNFSLVAVFIGSRAEYIDRCGGSSRCYRQYYGTPSRGYIMTVDDWMTFYTMEIAFVTFGFLLLVLHFILFVRFCIETNRRNQIRPVYVVAAPGGPAPGMYYTQPQYMMQPGAMYAPQQQQQLSPPPNAHTSMYGGYFAPGQQPVPPMKSTSSPGPEPSEISTETGHHNGGVQQHNGLAAGHPQP